MIANTRTTLSNPFYVALAWYMPYHSEHHSFPRVPCYHLPKLFCLLDKISINKSGCNPNGEKGYFYNHYVFVKSLQKV